MAFVCKNGTCIPSDLAQVGVFKALQRAINSVIEYACAIEPNGRSEPVSWKLCMYVNSVDGKIGPKTMASAMDLVWNTGLNKQFPQPDDESAEVTTYRVAANAGPLAEALSKIVNRPVDARPAPRWLAVVSPPAWYAWAARSFWKR